MRRLVLPGDRSGDRRYIPDEKTSRYLLRVLRLKKGDAFSALDEKGHSFLCAIEGNDPSGAVLALESAPPAAGPVSGAASAQPRIALVQGLPKGQKMDLILRQAVETGVEAVFPIQTRRSVVRELGDEAAREVGKGAVGSDGKLQRRMKIVREALQQSGSLIYTKVMPTSSIDTLVGNLRVEGFPPESSLYLMFHERALSGESLHELCAGEPVPTVILIGPEGGFAPDETEAFLGMGFQPLHFEGAILRTETAALFATAAVKTILMERNSWTASK